MIVIDNFVCFECRVPPCLCTMMILQLRCIQTNSRKTISGLQLCQKRVFCIQHTLYGHNFGSHLYSFMRLKPLTSKSCNHDTCKRMHTHTFYLPLAFTWLEPLALCTIFESMVKWLGKFVSCTTYSQWDGDPSLPIVAGEHKCSSH